MFNHKLLTRKFLLWFGWVTVNALGAAIGVLACACVGIKTLQGTSSYFPSYFIFALMTAISVSTCQARFLRKEYIPKQRTEVVKVWTFVSSFCSTLMIIGAPIIMLFSFFIFFILIRILPLGVPGLNARHLNFGAIFAIFGFVSGVITGFAQHSLLPKPKGKSNRLWILYSGIGCALGLSIAAMIVSILFKEPIFTIDGYSKAKWLSMYGMMVFNIVGGIINGAVTGIEIVRLFGELQPRYSASIEFWEIYQRK